MTEHRKTKKTAVERISELRAKRDKLAARIKTLDAQIAKLENAAREHEQREIMNLIKSRNLTAAQLEQILAGAGGVKQQL